MRYILIILFTEVNKIVNLTIKHCLVASVKHYLLEDYIFSTQIQTRFL